MTLSAGALPTDSFGYRSDGGYSPGNGVLPIQLGTPTTDTATGAGNQQSAPVVVQMASSQQISVVDGVKATYSAAKVGLVPASSATDIFTVTGSATKTVRVTHIEITATTTSATPAALDVLLLKRSTANSAGTSTGSPTPVPHDSNNAAVSATVLSYTANPTTGNLVGTAIRNSKFFQTLATYTATDFPAKDSITWDFGNRPGQAIVLRGTGDVLAINLNGVSATATASFDISIEWTEE